MPGNLNKSRGSIYCASDFQNNSGNPSVIAMQNGTLLDLISFVLKTYTEK